MKQKTCVVLLLTILLFAAKAHAYDAPLKVEIKLAQATVQNVHPLSIATTIRNISSTMQELQVLSCSYPESWVTDNPAVSIRQVPCDENGIITVHLKPGDTYDKELSALIGLAAEKLVPQSVTFRLGFQPSVNSNGLFVVWSNPITINVVE